MPKQFTISFNAPLSLDIPQASASKTAAVFNALKKAKRPVLFVGSQTMLNHSNVQSGKFSKALEAIGVPVFLSGMARGCMGASNPLQVRHKDSRRVAFKDADLVIFAGVPCDFRTNYGRNISRSAKFISVNRDSVDLYKNRSPDIAVFADPSDFIIQLAALGSSKSEPWKVILYSE
jgi:thiamine pyrophosphate-dependent acetolactate synthase large subunit-like protein